MIHLKKQFSNKVEDGFKLEEEIEKGKDGMIICNLKARLGFVLRQYKELKKERKRGKHHEDKMTLIK